MTKQLRLPIIRAWNDELIADSFAGGGGASLGIELALGRSPDVAINHDPEAIAMHAANHPETRHHIESVWDVDPRVATGGRPVALAWFSPDCKHHSKAKGGKPRDQKIRGLAWIAVTWAQQPMHTVMAGAPRFGLVASFLARYNGASTGQPPDAPLSTVDTRDRFGLVTVTIDGEEYAIVDIGMRMLTPRELFRAQGFGDEYRIDPQWNGKPLTKTAQIRMCGNSVCPPVAAAIVRAQLLEAA